MSNPHACPVCGYSGDLEFFPRDYQICGCCGTEFGYDDRVLSHDQLRAEWMQKGCPWFDPDEHLRELLSDASANSLARSSDDVAE